MTQDDKFYYMEGIDSWDDAIYNKTLKVNGILKVETFKEEDLKNEKGEWKQGMIGEKLTIQNPNWEIVSSKNNGNTITNETKKLKTEDISTGENKFIVTAPIVKKRFENKIGIFSDFEELYLQRSIQDYFIKFCESKVNRIELENYLNTHGGILNMLTLEVEFRDGDWDACAGDQNKQSRTGMYVIIHNIISSDDVEEK